MNSVLIGKRPRPVAKLAVDKTKSPTKKVPDKTKDNVTSTEKITDHPEESATGENLDTSLVGTSIGMIFLLEI